MKNRVTIAYEEVSAIFKQWPVWVMLGTQDIQLKYRRSSIGPLWITISMAVTIYTIGFLYAYLFKVPLVHYFPYLASSIISWSFVSTLILEGNNVFIEAEQYVKNQESYMSLYMMRLILRSVIIFIHNLLVFIPVALMFDTGIHWNILFIIPGFIIIGINALTWGTLIAMCGTRFRDFGQILASFIQVVFFLTPIMWMPDLLPKSYQWIVQMNPFYYFLELIRAPLLGGHPSMHGMLITSLCTIMGLFLYAHCLGTYKHRVVFWL
jgi:lipopolysaccharide transport system permease protein